MAGKDSHGASAARRAKADAKDKARRLKARGTWTPRKPEQLELPLDRIALEEGVIYHPCETGMEPCEACTEWAKTAERDEWGYFIGPSPCDLVRRRRLEAFTAEHKTRGITL